MHPLGHLVALLRLKLCVCSRPKAASPWVGVAPAAVLTTCCLSGGCAAASTDSPSTLHCTLSSTCNCLSRHSGDLAGGTGKEGQAGSWHLKHGTARRRQAGVGRDIPAVAAAALRCRLRCLLCFLRRPRERPRRRAQWAGGGVGSKAVSCVRTLQKMVQEVHGCPRATLSCKRCKQSSGWGGSWEVFDILLAVFV